MTIQVRQSTYRGKAGFSITGRPNGQVGGWPVKIFTLTRDSADRIAAKVRQGQDIGLADFQ